MSALPRYLIPRGPAVDPGTLELVRLRNENAALRAELERARAAVKAPKPRKAARLAPDQYGTLRKPAELARMAEGHPPFAMAFYYGPITGYAVRPLKPWKSCGEARKIAAKYGVQVAI